MKPDYHRVLLVFADGVGLAPAAASNPLAAEPTPGLERLVGGQLTLEGRHRRDESVLEALDATLGVDGLPQSATGQATLFTGRNCARLMGRHITGFPGPRLKGQIEEQGLFRRALALGCRAVFANAYSGDYRERLRRGERRPSVTTCAVMSAGLPLLGGEALRRGEAVSWDIRRDLFGRSDDRSLNPIAAKEAGRDLARLAQDHHLTVFETFVTDLAGHGRWGISAADALARVDGLLLGLAEELDPATTLVLTSDHGNLEDGSHRSHTRNSVPLLAVGPQAGRFSGADSIRQVTPLILECVAGGR